ncbi:MAG: D-alanyl-D-alanine carboxypeptidase family protein [Nitrospirota bacterium]
MQERFKVESSKLKVNAKGLYFLFLLLFTFHFSLSTSFAGEINSRAAVVMDAETGRILYAKNPNLRLLPASTAKLMTAIVVMENADLKGVARISKNAANVSPLKAGFKEGDKVTIETLLYAALLKSANDAAVALAEAVAGSEERFVSLMNMKAIAIGAMDTKFINPNGLPGSSQYITAYDLSKIMRYAIRYPKIREIIGTRVTGVSTEGGSDIFLKNTNKLLWSDEDLLGGKTGYTRKAGHCFVCAAERGKNTVIIALLGSPSREDLWKESGVLINKGFSVMANREEPVVYFAKADYETANLKKVSYRKSSKFKVKSSKLKTDKRIAKKMKHKRTRVFAKKKGKAKVFVKKRAKSKTFVKDLNRGKDYKFVKKDDRNKG